MKDNTVYILFGRDYDYKWVIGVYDLRHDAEIKLEQMEEENLEQDYTLLYHIEEHQVVVR